MTGKVRRILLFLLTLIVLGAIAFALYALRGLEGLPLIGGKDKEPVVTEAPEPVETQAPESVPAETPEIVVAEEPESSAGVSGEPEENVSSTLSGALHTAAGDLRYKSEILAPGSGEDADSVSLGHVYASKGKIRVQFFRDDGSALQPPIELDYASENLFQEPRCQDLNGDGSDELVLRLHTYEDEHAVLLLAFNPETGAYEQAAFTQPGVLIWGTDFDAASGRFCYRHGAPTISYDCFELQGTSLTMVRRLEDDRQADEGERFTEYEVVGDRLLIVKEKVPATDIDRDYWSFVNFN